MQSDSSPSFDASIGAALKSLLEVHGVPLLGNAPQLKALLTEQAPQAKREVAVLLQALDAGVPQSLLRPQPGEAPMASALRLADHLSHETAMSPEAAQWAVQTWKVGIGLGSGPGAGTGLVDPATSFGMPVAATRPAAAQRLPHPTAAIEVSSRSVEPSAARRDPKLMIAGAVGAVVLAGGGAWWALGHSSLAVTAVRPAQTQLIGDGKPQPVMLAFNAKNTELRAVEVRYLKGDGNWKPANWTVNVDSNGRNSGELAAGSLAYRTTATMNTTFEYTLVSKDGKRSAPFEQTFSILPPVTITRVQLPSPPRLGQPYAVQLAYTKGAGEIVQITRRVVDSSVPWAQPEQTMAVNINQASGTYDMRFDAPTEPMRSTVEFEMVDSLGVKSEPVRLALNVAVQPITSGPATVQSVALVSGGGAATGVGAVAGGVTGAALGNTIGRGSGRTAATVVGAVGGAFAGHQIEKNVRGPSVWETAVRFDDGNVRRIRHSNEPRWGSGDRVMVSGGSISR